MVQKLSPSYQPRRSSETTLYAVLREHLDRFVQTVEAADHSLPSFVLKELAGFLRCGQLAYGFVRQACSSCTFERLVGFSCSGRGFCPSCLGRRMVEGAARLVDSILPHAPYRQYVLTLPKPLRFAIAYNPTLCSRIISIFVNEVFRWQKKKAKLEFDLDSVAHAHCGAATAIHRSSSALSLNIHFHSAVMDGVFVLDQVTDTLRFRALAPPTRDDLHDITCRIYARTRKLCIALGCDWEEPESIDNTFEEDEPLLAGCAQSSMRGTALLGDHAGQSLLPFARPALHIPADLRQRLACGGFDLHAARRVRADDRKGLDQLCSYFASCAHGLPP